MPLEIVLALHEGSLRDFGGGSGMRDRAHIATARLYSTFAGENLYPSAIEKAAAIGESIVINHPFVDGNKRTGFLAMLAMLDELVFTIDASNADTYEFLVAIASGEKPVEEIVDWLERKTKPL